MKNDKNKSDNLHKTPKPADALLTIAGSDCSGHAGIQADLKTFAALGLHGSSVITAVTCQNHEGVLSTQGIDPSMVECQLNIVLQNQNVLAMKSGMLFSRKIVETVAQVLNQRKDRLPFLVIDPVLSATSGESLLTDDAMQSLFQLFSIATLITPNIPEAEKLLQKKAGAGTEKNDFIRELYDQWGTPILLKGGHAFEEIEKTGKVTDTLFDGNDFYSISFPFQDRRNTRGTGCILSAAICGYLGKGLPLKAAAEAGRTHLNNVLLDRQ